MTCLSVEVEQYDMQRSMDMKEKKKKEQWQNHST